MFDRALDGLDASRLVAFELVGEPGIGKSRLMAEVRRRAELRGYLVLDGRAAEYERGLPFGVAVDALNDCFGELEPAILASLGDDAVAELAAIFPALARPEAQPPDRRLDAERYRAHYAIRAVLERLAARRPVVLTLDDVHWSDDASVEVLAHLLRRFRGPLLVVCALRQRPAHLGAALDAAEREGLARRLELAPLSREEADQLLAPRLDDAAKDALYREAGGNPFYLDELGRAAARAGHTMGPQPTPSMEPWAQQAAAPAGVVAAIREELSSLSAGAGVALRAAAVAGESFEPALVAAVADQPDPVALAAIDELLAADLLRPTDVPRRFRFRHPIVRNAVYEGAPRAWRLGAHARAAATLEGEGVAAPARAHHIERSASAGDEEAVVALVEAAHAASARAPRAAGRWLLAAARILPAGADVERQGALLSEAARSLGQAGAFEQALEALEEALALVPAERVAERARIIGQIAAVKRLVGRPLESRALLERAMESLPDPDDEDGHALRLELALDHYSRGEFAEMGALATVTLRSPRAGDHAVLTSLAAAITSLADSSSGRIDEGLVQLEDAQARLDALDDEALAERIDLCGWVGMAAFRLERIEITLADARRGLALARATGQGSMFPGLLALEGHALLLAGRVTEAVKVAETAADAALLSGHEQLIIWTLQTVATAATWAGDTRRALASARESVSLWERLGESYFSPLARLHLAGALRASGDPAGARAELAALESQPGLLELGGAYGWELLTLAHLELGDLDAAAVAATRAEERAAAVPLPQQRATALLARAVVLLARGDAGDAADAARESAALGARAGNPLLSARARIVVGRSLVASGDREDGIAELEGALATLSGCGAGREVDAAARELRRLGRHVTRRVRPAPGGVGVSALSAREREVAEHVATGKTNRAVAAALFLSEKTVESHLARMYDKLGVRSRTELAVALRREEPVL